MQGKKIKSKSYLFIYLFIALICLVIGTEFILRKIPNDYSYKANYLKANGNNVKTLILGSSHVFVGLDPKLMHSKAFNVAHSSQTLNLDYEIFEKYKNYLPNLKTVIIPISYFSYTGQLDDKSIEKKLKYYNIYWDINTGYNDINYNSELLSMNIGDNYNRLKRYIIYRQNDITIDTNGYIKKRLKFNWDDKINSVKAFKRHRSNLSDTIVQNRVNENVFNLDKIIKWSDKHKVQIILLSTPTTNGYKELVLNTNQYNIVRNNTNKLKRLNKSVIWLDFFQNNKDFDLNDFQDSDHLNVKGANKLTMKLDSIIENNVK